MLRRHRLQAPKATTVVTYRTLSPDPANRTDNSGTPLAPVSQMFRRALILITLALVFVAAVGGGYLGAMWTWGGP
jgi:hypothetical protein